MLQKESAVYAVSATVSDIVKQSQPEYTGLEEALKEDDTDLRIFGKPVARLHRRMGVMLTSAPLGSDLNQLRDKCKRLAALVKVC